MDEALADGRGFGCESSLFLFVEASASDRLDRDGLQAVGGEVVGTRAHVEVTEFESELKGIEEEVGAGPGHGFECPFVEVHVGMDAGWLFEVLTGEEIRLEFIERTCGGVEEAEGVEVRAADGVGFDEGIDFCLGKAEGGCGGVADFGTAVDHGPFVEAVAGKVRGALGGAFEEVDHPVKSRDLLVGEQGRVCVDEGIRLSIGVGLKAEWRGGG